MAEERIMISIPVQISRISRQAQLSTSSYYYSSYYFRKGNSNILKPNSTHTEKINFILQTLKRHPSRKIVS
jgi:hypothetical protein